MAPLPPPGSGTTVIINPNEYFEIKKRIMSKEYGFFVEKRNFVSEVTVMRIVRG